MLRRVDELRINDKPLPEAGTVPSKPRSGRCFAARSARWPAVTESPSTGRRPSMRSPRTRSTTSTPSRTVTAGSLPHPNPPQLPRPRHLASRDRRRSVGGRPRPSPQHPHAPRWPADRSRRDDHLLRFRPSSPSSIGILRRSRSPSQSAPTEPRACAPRPRRRRGIPWIGLGMVSSTTPRHQSSEAAHQLR